MQFYGGHTAGSCIVFAKDFLIVADEAYYKRNFTDRVRIRNCYSPEKAQQFVEKYAVSDYRLLFFHDDSIMPSKIGYEVVYNDD